jgi:hypothetical protein
MVPHLGTGRRTSIGDHLRRCRSAHHPRATRRRVPNPSELDHPGRSRSDVRLKHYCRSEQAQLALERRVAARVGVLLHQLMTQVGAPGRRAGPSRRNSRRTVSRHTPNSRASALTVQP